MVSNEDVIINDFLMYFNNGKDIPRRLMNKKCCSIFLSYLYAKNIITDNDLRTRKFGIILNSLKLKNIATLFAGETDLIIPYMSKGNVQIWETPFVKASVWESKDNVKKYVRWLCLKNNLRTKREVLKGFNTSLIKKPLLKLYSVPELLEIGFPGQFHPWELNYNKIKNPEDVKAYMYWYLFEKCRLDENTITETLTRSMIPKHLFSRFSLKHILRYTFSDKYTIWDFKRIKFIWNEDNIKEYIEMKIDKYNLTIDEIYANNSLVLDKVNYTNTRAIAEFEHQIRIMYLQHKKK